MCKAKGVMVGFSSLCMYNLLFAHFLHRVYDEAVWPNHTDAEALSLSF